MYLDNMGLAKAAFPGQIYYNGCNYCTCKRDCITELSCPNKCPFLGERMTKSYAMPGEKVVAYEDTEYGEYKCPQNCICNEGQLECDGNCIVN